MSLRAIAKKDFQDSIRSRWLIGLVVLFALIMSAAAYVGRPAPGETASSEVLLRFLDQFIIGTLVPLLGLVVGYNAVSGERDSGSLKLLLSLPHSRADVVFGKVLGRAGALTSAIMIGFLVPAAIIATGPFRFEVPTFVGYLLLVCILATMFVSIAVGLSAASESRWLAMAGAIGLYFLFVPLWNAIQFPLQMWLAGGGAGWFPLTGVQVQQILQVFRPNGAFNVISQNFLGGTLFDAELRSRHASAAAMLVFWTLAPPLFGLLKFEREDL